MTTTPPAAIDRIRSWGMLAVLVTTFLVSSASAGWKTLCTGPVFGGNGATDLEISRLGSLLCYSDSRALWGARNLGEHIFPYSGSYTPDGQLTGGVVEYPVLSGFFLWLTGLPAATDREFVLITGLVLAVAATAVAFLLYALVGRRAYLWAAAPGLLVYSAYNVDVLPVLATVAAFAVMLWPSDDPRRASRAYTAAVLLGIGGALKIYPLMFALPVALWLAFGPAGDERRRFGWGHLVGVLATAGGILVAANAVFALRSFEGWLASFQFQGDRLIDHNSMAIWWWVPHLLGFEVADRTAVLTAVAAFATAAAFIVATVVAVRSARGGAEIAWLPYSAALLVAFMVLNKVNSPQYLLWLIPFFVLLKVRWPWIAAYYIADLAIFYGYFRPFYLVSVGRPADGVDTLLAIGILARAVLLALLFVRFLRKIPAEESAPFEAVRSGEGSGTRRARSSQLRGA